MNCAQCADAIAETARTADELAFWKHQAIYHRAYALMLGSGNGNDARQRRGVGGAG